MIEYTDKFIELTVRPDFTCVDVGANVGDFTVQMLGLIGDRGTVIAIEPLKKFYDQLHSRTGHLKNVELHNVGIWDESEYHKSKPAWYAQEIGGNHGNAGLTHEPDMTQSVNRVELKLLDQIICSRMVHFIKIDVEGMEFEVINSGIASIAMWKPMILFETRREFEVAFGRKIFEPIFEILLKPFGYSLFNYTPEKGLHKVTVDELGTDTLAKVVI